MIEQFGEHYSLECDWCGNDSGEIFDEFMDAVRFKQDRDNGWTSKKTLDGTWEDLCSDCR